MPSLQIDQLNKRAVEWKTFGDYIRKSLAFFRTHPSTERPVAGSGDVQALDVSPECQTEYDLALAADANYAAAVATTNAAMANEQAKDLLRQGAWETYWNCETP